MPFSSPPTCQRQPKIDQLSASNPTPRTGRYSVAVDTTQSPSKTQLHQVCNLLEFTKAPEATQYQQSRATWPSSKPAEPVPTS
jgi:hypothetical protein